MMRKISTVLDPAIRGTLVLLTALSAGCSGGGGGSEPAGTALPLAASSVEFGQTGPGTQANRTLLIRNPAGGLPVRVTAIEPATTEILLVPPILPLTVAPGDQIPVELSWTPQEEGFFSSWVRVEADDRAPLDVAVSGTGFASETRVNLGLVPLDAGGRTAELAFDVPADAISFTIEAWGNSRTNPSGGTIRLDRLVGPDGHVYVDDAAPLAGPYWMDRNFPADSFQVPKDHSVFLVPNTDADDVELAAGGGEYRFVLAHGGALTQLSAQITIERRLFAADAISGHIDLNVFIAAGLSASAGNAASSAHLQTILKRADDILGSVGLGFGAIDYYKLTNPVFDVANPFDPSALFRQSSMAREPRLNVFLVVASTNGVAGLTGALPCPRVLGSPTAGIFVIGNEGLHPNDLGTVLAHEIGHALGLGHTKEAQAIPWLYDRIEDTCPGTRCFGDPVSYLMDASTIPPVEPVITPGQAGVIHGHVFVDPGRATFVPGAILNVSPLLAWSGDLACANCR